MFTNGFVAALFRIINFALVVAIVVYLFKKYGMRAITGKMEQQEDEHLTLLHKKADCEAEQALIGQKIQEDALLCVSLRQRVDQWKQAEDARQAVLHTQQCEQSARAHTNAEKRALIIQEEKIQVRVQAQVVDELEKSLCLYFTPQKGKEYVDKIIHFMDERYTQ